MFYVFGNNDDILRIAGTILNVEYGLDYFIDGVLNDALDIYAKKNTTSTQHNIYIPDINIKLFIRELHAAIGQLESQVIVHVRDNVIDALLFNDLVPADNSSNIFITRTSGRRLISRRTGKQPENIQFIWTLNYISHYYRNTDYIKQYPSHNCPHEAGDIFYDKYNMFIVNNNPTLAVPEYILNISDCSKIHFNFAFTNPMLPSLYSYKYETTRDYTVKYHITGNIKDATCIKCNKKLSDICFYVRKNCVVDTFCAICYKHCSRYNKITTASAMTVDTTFLSLVSDITPLNHIYGHDNYSYSYSCCDGDNYTLLLMGEELQYIGVLDNNYVNINMRLTLGERFDTSKEIVNITLCK